MKLLLRPSWTPLFCTDKYLQYKTVRDKLIKFPYTRLNEKIMSKSVEIDPNDFLHNNFMKDSVAFSSLKQFQQNLLQNNYQYLFNKTPDKNQSLTGSQIFIKHFKQNMASIKNAINQSENQQQVIYNLKILFYLKQNTNIENQLSDVDFSKIQQSKSLKKKAYLLKLYENTPKLLSYIQKYVQDFKTATKQQQMEAAFVILSIPQFDKMLPKNLCEMCIDKISQKVEQMDDWEQYRVLQLIFNTEMAATRRYVEKVMKHLFKQITEQNGHTKMPLMLKMIKLRDKLNMDNTEFQNYIKNNPLKFNSIFFKKKINKQAFLDTIATKDSRRYLPEEIKIHFVTYILKVFNDIIKANQCDSQELIQNIKMSLKFYYNFSQTNVHQIQQKIHKQLLPMFSHETQIAFWLVTLLLRIDKTKIKDVQVLKTIKNILVQYDKKYFNSKIPFEKHINLQKVIELYYHMIRSQIPVQNIQKLTAYDFKYVSTFQQIIYASYIIIYANLTSQQKYKMFERMIPKIQSLLQQGKFKSIKNVFTILTALSRSKCQESANSKSIGFLYKKIEYCLIRLFGKSKVCLSFQQLRFIKKAFTQGRKPNNENPETQNKGMHNYHFIVLIDQCIKTPQNFKIYLNDYLKNHSPTKNKRKV